jgi:hypothetical protein
MALKRELYKFSKSFFILLQKIVLLYGIKVKNTC